ncbi:MAG: cold shock CspA family protein [Saprospiraceae bacterium]|jgi:cold shock CspA family protein
MAKSQQSFNKKEKEKKRRKKNQDKMERREQRKVEKEERGKLSFEDQLTYVDENGYFTDTPPDPAKKTKIKIEDVIISVPLRDNTPYDPIRKGRVKFFNGEKGYGFLIDVETEESVFVHINNLLDPVQEHDKVTFEVEMGPKGPNAVNVKKA